MPPDYAAILRLIPVRHPIVLVDRVLSLDPGVGIETAKAVSGSEPCFAGLAGGLPASRWALPRSLVLESFVQSAALLWLSGEREPGDDEDWVPIVGRLRRCRYRGDALVGDVIRHTVRLHEVVGSSTAFLSGESRVGDRTILSVGALTAVRRPSASVLPAIREGQSA